jgi:CRISPR-associated protein Cas1
MAAVSLVGFDPYLGCLHTVEYGRPSLALDLMEEWRPVIVDSLVLSVFNLKAITTDDFIFSRAEDAENDEDRLNEEPISADDLVEDGPVPAGSVQDDRKGLPVKLTDAGFRKFIAQFERKMGEKVRFHLTGQQFSYRDCIREQARHFARYVRGEDKEYQPMLVR